MYREPWRGFLKYFHSDFPAGLHGKKIGSRPEIIQVSNWQNFSQIYKRGLPPTPNYKVLRPIAKSLQQSFFIFK